MALLSLEELSLELSVSKQLLEDLITQHIITPYGGRARLGEPRFSHTTLPTLKKTIAKTLHIV